MNQEVEIVNEADSTTSLGFWIYLMTDCVLFATLFATFAVLRGNTNGGPAGAELFSLPNVLAETIILLTSSFTAGLGTIAARRGDRSQVLVWFGLTMVLGLAFLGLEIHEFSDLVASGNGPARSGFLSAFFTLVATHGLHIATGLLWMVVLLAKVWRRGVTAVSVKRLALLSVFWHFLDLIWIFIFTIVYLTGAINS